MNEPRTFSQFVAADLQPRSSGRITTPAPVTSAAASEAERELRAVFDRPTVRIPFASSSAMLADLDESWCA